MHILPPIEDRIISRPGSHQGKIPQFVPDLTYDEFWEDFYIRINKILGLKFPLKGNAGTIDPYFGHFGTRFHPVTKTPHYFHVGIDILAPRETLVYPILEGIFEYSGFSSTNGKYVLLSHPEVQTDDGFNLWSIYMHLDRYTIKFTKYQKMLREMSFHNHPKIPLKTRRSIGSVGTTGDLRGMVPHLHLQIELRHRDKIIVLDGAKVFGLESKENKTSAIETIEGFENFCTDHAADLEEWKTVWDANK